MKYDYLLIGGGLGNLTLASLLSKQGKKVALFDKHFMPGGYAITFNRNTVYNSRGYDFEGSLHEMGGIKKTRVKKILENTGIVEEIQFLKPKYLFEKVTKKGTVKVPNGDVFNYIKDLFTRYPREKLGIIYYFIVMWLIGTQVKIWDLRKVNLGLKIIISILAPILIPVLIISEFFPFISSMKLMKSDELKDELNTLSDYYGKPGEEISLQFQMAANYSYYFDGAYFPKGGGGKLSKSLSESISSSGGDVFLRHKVKEIIVDEGRAVGVRVKNLKTKENLEYYSGKIISGISPYLTYQNLMDDSLLEEESLLKLKGMELSLSFSVLYLGLGVDICKLVPNFKDSYEVFLEGGDVLSIHSNLDKTCTSLEKSTLTLTYIDDYARWDGISKAQYLQKKKEESEYLINRLENVIPEIKKYIEVSTLATPKTMERYTGNPKGAVYGFSQKVSQSGRRRFSYESPIRGLYFCSAYTQPGGGYEGVMRAADNLANLVLKG